MKRENLAALKSTVTADKDITISLDTKIDTDIWNIHGEHFTVIGRETNLLKLETVENKIPLFVYEQINGANNHNKINLRAGEEFSLTKLCGIYWGEKTVNSAENFKSDSLILFDTLLDEHKAVWDKIWENCDVKIEGDDEDY